MRCLVPVTFLICCTLLVVLMAGSPDLLDIAIVRFADLAPLCEKPVSPVDGVILE